jgi:hypothetical protein
MQTTTEKGNARRLDTMRASKNSNNATTIPAARAPVNDAPAVSEILRREFSSLFSKLERQRRA